jgi:hypothetical protein
LKSGDRSRLWISHFDSARCYVRRLVFRCCVAFSHAAVAFLRAMLLFPRRAMLLFPHLPWWVAAMASQAGGRQAAPVLADPTLSLRPMAGAARNPHYCMGALPYTPSTWTQVAQPPAQINGASSPSCLWQVGHRCGGRGSFSLRARALPSSCFAETVGRLGRMCNRPISGVVVPGQLTDICRDDDVCLSTRSARGYLNR